MAESPRSRRRVWLAPTRSPSGDTSGWITSEKWGLRLAVRLGFRLIEVSTAVDEQQPVTAATTESQHVPQHDGAVAAEHHGEVACLDHGASGLGKLVPVVQQSGWIEQTCCR